MSAYRVFFLGEHGGVVGSHEFDAPRDADATAIAGLLADAVRTRALASMSGKPVAALHTNCR